MAGHSRWAQVKHRKAGADAKRSAVFSRLARLITVAARNGGPDPEANPKLRQAITQAREAGIPGDNIRRAIERAAGAGSGDTPNPVTYEAYGPGGVAILVIGTSDNPNRTTAEVKQLLAGAGGRLAEAGSVAWIFERRMELVFRVPAGGREAAALALIDAGADDLRAEDGTLLALVSPERMGSFRAEAARRGFRPVSNQPTMAAKRSVALGATERRAASGLLEALRSHPDVTAVWSNAADGEEVFTP